MANDLQSFKLAMRRLAAGVCLITTKNQDGTRRGMTATAVCSVSAAPPTLLCCINRTNSTYEAIRAAGSFAVNVLCVDNRILADVFARPIPPEEKFSKGRWLEELTGAPVLESALAAFDCRISQDVTAGTHGIIFGEIQAIRVRDVEAKPLLYAHGGYGGFTSFPQDGDLDSFWTPGWEIESA